ncbi:MAG: pyrroline-5-carboxylate reductase [Phycisphaerales bacterium JB063]
MAHTLGFIGCGNMAQAIAHAAIRQGVVPAQDIIASNPSAPKRELFASWGCDTTDDNTQVIRSAKQIVLGVKPQVFPDVAPTLRNDLTDEHVLISVMAGLSGARIAELVGRPCRVVRAMPNTPLRVGRGATGVARCDNARPGDEALAMKLFEAGGLAIAIGEEQINAVAAVSGSGPAYVFLLAEAMQQAAVELGLADHAEALVTQTLLGSAELLTDSDDDAPTLRRKVTSPKGTTEAAIRVMQDAGLSATVVQALKANVARSEQLAAR